MQIAPPKPLESNQQEYKSLQVLYFFFVTESLNVTCKTRVFRMALSFVKCTGVAAQYLQRFAKNLRTELYQHKSSDFMPEY